MNRKRLAGIIAAGVVVVVPVLLFAVVIPALTLPLPPKVTPQPEMVTLDCTDVTPTSLQARGEVEDISIGPLWVRGFVYTEWTEGASTPTVIPLANPSFESANLRVGWSFRDGHTASRVSDPVKVGHYALKYEYARDTRYSFARSILLDRNRWSGRTVTVAAWVKTDIAGTVSIRCTEWGGAWNSWATSFHTGDGEWQLLTGTGTVPPDLRSEWAVVIRGAVRDYDYAFYIDGVVLFDGSAVFEHGEFGEGPFSLTIDDLEPDTSYSIRAFGVNDGGPAHGDIVACRTLASP